MSDAGGEARLREHLSLFIECADQLHRRLTEWQEDRESLVRELIESDGTLPTRFERLEQNIIEGASVVYREARRLGLETDPRPVLDALIPADGEEGAEKAVARARDALLALVLDAQARLPETAGPADPTDTSDYVTLDQAASIAHKSKRTLERYKTKGELPAPAVEGGAGRADLYDWKVMRPWLVQEFGVPCPNVSRGAAIRDGPLTDNRRQPHATAPPGLRLARVVPRSTGDARDDRTRQD